MAPKVLKRPPPQQQSLGMSASPMSISVHRKSASPMSISVQRKSASPVTAAKPQPHLSMASAKPKSALELALEPVTVLKTTGMNPNQRQQPKPTNNNGQVSVLVGGRNESGLGNWKPPAGITIQKKVFPKSPEKISEAEASLKNLQEKLGKNIKEINYLRPKRDSSVCYLQAPQSHSQGPRNRLLQWKRISLY